MADLSVTVSDSSQTFENVMFRGYDSHYNLAYSTVATAPSPASSGTQLTLAAGDGSDFSPGTYNATVWPANTAPQDDNAEIIRVTGISGDILQIVRTQEGTPARSIQVGDQIASSITAKTLTDIENEAFNAYNFRVYRNAAYNSVSITNTAMPFDAKNDDTSSNVDIVTNKGRFTASVAGFYQFNGGYGTNTNQAAIYLAKNGSIVSTGTTIAGISAANISLNVADRLKLALGDYVEVYYFINGVNAIVTGSANTYFSGFLVSLT